MKGPRVMGSSRYLAIAVTSVIAVSCARVPEPTGPGGAVFDVTVRVVDGRVLTGQSVYRPGVPDVFCVRNADLACKGTILDATSNAAEISFVFDCDEGTDGIAFVQRDIRNGTIVPTGGVVRKRNRVWAEIDITLQRRDRVEDAVADLEACERRAVELRT